MAPRTEALKSSKRVDSSLRLVDLTGTWFMQVGGAATDALGSEAETIAWATDFHRTLPVAAAAA